MQHTKVELIDFVQLQLKLQHLQKMLDSLIFEWYPNINDHFVHESLWQSCPMLNVM